MFSYFRTFVDRLSEVIFERSPSINKEKMALSTDDLLQTIKDELARARLKFPNFNSAHEGYAVLLEEVDELWAEIKANGDQTDMRDEAIQIAAMAVRFIEDCCACGEGQSK